MSGAVPLFLLYALMVWGARGNFTYCPVLIPSKDHSASYSKGNRIFFSREYGGEGVTLPRVLHLLA